MADEIDRTNADKSTSESRLRHPLVELRKEVNRLFENYSPHFTNTEFEPLRWIMGNHVPAMDFTKRENEYELTAELPGLQEGEFEIMVWDHTLTLKGEKTEEREEKKKDYYLSERHFGSFERTMKLPEDADTSGIDASFKDGVLKILIPKSEEAKAAERKISVRSA